MSLQYRVTVTDQHGQEHDFVVVAGGEREASDKGRDYLRKQVPGARPVSIACKIEARHP